MPAKAWRALAEVLARPLRVADRVAASTVGGADSVPPARAIIVLGAPLSPDGQLSELGGERVRAAAELWRRGGAPRVVVSGGVTRGAVRSEAAVMADGLVALGVPRQAILVEEQSLTTAENAIRCAELLGAQHAERAAAKVADAARGDIAHEAAAATSSEAPIGAVWLVTQPFHARRAQRYFRRQGFAPRVWHIADSIAEQDPRAAVRWSLREYLAWVKALTWG
jgi:uncharacterized SAM-binding protein YcdF (DUF218 family)